MKNKKKKKLLYFFTGKRGGFSHFIPIIRLLKNKKEFNYKILASDMHLSEYFGKTINEVKHYSHNVVLLKNKKIEDSVSNRLSVISSTISHLTKIFKKKTPDFLILLGDRAEVLGASIAGLHFNVPIVHMYGGDITQGGADEPTRHAISKISNIHLTSNSSSYQNVKKMREENWRVHNTGLSSLDLLKDKFYKPKKYLEKKYKIDLKKPLIILIQHPVTWQIGDSKKQINETLKALNKLKIQTIAVYPCSDPGFNNIVKSYEKFKRKNFFRLYKNIEIEDFYSLLKYSKMLIGNSSCGITECGYLMKYAINIGIRQQGRAAGKNVFHVNHNSKKIINQINKILKKPKLKKKILIYGNGNSAKKIINIISKCTKRNDLIKKKFI